MQRFAVLRHRDYRLFWIGFVISVSGEQLLWMMKPWLIYEISGSTTYLGINALAQAVPATVLALLGGVIADKFDQRKLLIGVQAAQIAILSVLAILALSGAIEVWHMFVASFIRGGVSAFENPARQSMFPHLVSREAIPNAVALNATVHPGTAIGAPVLGGIILASVLGATGSPRFAAGAVLLVAIVAAAVYAAILAQVHLPPVVRSRGGMVGDMAAGVRFIWRDRIFALLIGVAYYNMFFGMSLNILFPVFAKDVLHVGPDVLGGMYGAMGIGSLVGVIVASQRAAPSQRGQMLVGGGLLLGAAMAGFALSPVYWVSLVTLFGVGAGAALVMVSIQQSLQMLVTNEFRGRVMGVWSLVHSGVQPLGAMQFSSIAALAGAPVSLVFGGLMVIAGAVFLAVRRPIERLRAAEQDELRVTR